MLDLMQDVIGNVQDIFRSELHLARAELKEEAAAAATPALLLGVGLVLGVHAIGLLLLALVYALAAYVAVWIAALVVGAGVAVVAGVMAGLGARGLRRVRVTPRRTISSLKENARWAKAQIG